jgi:hypothetical protein
VIRLRLLRPQHRMFSAALLALLVAASFVTRAAAQFETRAKHVLPSPGSAVATGDFNRDGKLDIAVEDDGVSVLLGNGDGTFQPPVNYLPEGTGRAIVVADFNGDGILDIAVPGLATNTVEVLLGNGDGTFQSPIISGTSGFPSFLAVGDFNHDHKLDLAMVDYPYISVLLGNGDGTFQPPNDNQSFVGGHEIAVGDFNGDHKLDVVVVGYGGPAYLGILLGNGDGTLQNALTYPLTYQPGSVSTADFNDDGNLDLAIAADLGGAVTVLLGNGDATFQPAVVYFAPVGGPVAIADFNGDGKLDMVLSAGPPAEVSEFLGNGDGTFQPPLFSEVGTGGSPVAGDFNNDGRPDVVLLNDLVGVITALNTGALSISPSAPVNFPRQLVNTTSAPEAVTLSNTGPAPISIASLKWMGDFGVATTCGSSIAPGAACTVSAAFEPKVTGNLHGMITLHDSASSRPQVILLAGQSTPLALSPAGLDFGNQKKGTTGPPRQMTVTNGSDAPVTFSDSGIGGTDYQDFVIQSDACGQQLAPGASCTVTIRFSPTQLGARIADSYFTIIAAPSPTPVTLVGRGT